VNVRIAAVALLGFAAVSCARRPSLPVLGAVPRFELTAQTGERFDSASLSGHPWVANFIFTTCTGPCPMMTAQMRRIQNLTADYPDVKLLSFTVDPAHDTAPVLAEYASRFNAQTGKWYFLTGEPPKLDALSFDTFHLHHVDGNLNHSTRFVLVDRRGQIRGYYGSTDENFMTDLLRDLGTLERERS
jgi:protein SCO1/2